MRMWRALVAVLVLGSMVGGVVPWRFVSATVGYTLTTVVSTEAAGAVVDRQAGTYEAWNTLRTAAVGTSAPTSVLGPEVYASTTSGQWKSIERSVVGFNIGVAGIASLADVTAVTVSLVVASKENTFTTTAPTVGLFRYSAPGANGWGGAVDVDDYNNALPVYAVSTDTLAYADATVGVRYTFVIAPSEWDDTLNVANGWAYFVIAEVNHDYTGSAPAWSSDKIMNIRFTDSAGASEPRLNVYEHGTVPDLTVTPEANDVIDGTVDGTERAASIIWKTPRAAYGGEKLWWTVGGASGAVVALELLDDRGQLVASHTDSVRVDGEYQYVVTLAATYSGFVRLHETVANIESTWGYVARGKAVSEAYPYVYARYTDYPQYSKPFADYAVKAGKLMEVHWKTTLSVADQANASLRVWYLGDSGSELFNTKIDALANTYFVNDASLDIMDSWRFALFVVNESKSGWEDYDGLIQNLDVTYGWDTSGWYQFLIYDDVVGVEYTTTHSAYWYLGDVGVDGVSFGFDKAQYSGGSTMVGTLYAGTASQVGTTLSGVSVAVLASDGVTALSAATGVLSGSGVTVSLPAPLGAGTYTVRLTLSGAGSFDYVFDQPVKVVAAGGGGGGKPLAERLNDSLETWGLDNAFGRWMITLVVCVVAFLIFRKSKLLRVIVPCLVVGAAILAGFLDKWLVIVLVLGLGVFLFAKLRGVATGGR